MAAIKSGSPITAPAGCSQPLQPHPRARSDLLLALVLTFLQLGIVSALTYFKLAPWARAYIKAVGDAPREAWSAKDLLLVAALTNRGMAVSVLLGGALLVGALSLPQALTGAAATSSLPLSVPVLAALIPAALVDWRVQHLPTRLLSVAGAVLLLGWF